MKDHKKVDKEWGYEIWFENNELYCGKLLMCKGHVWTSKGWYHYHPVKDETFFILSGILELDVEGKTHFLGYGDTMRIKPGTRHRFRSSTMYCTFIEVSTTHDDEDSIRVENL